MLEALVSRESDNGISSTDREAEANVRALQHADVGQTKHLDSKPNLFISYKSCVTDKNNTLKCAFLPQ